jgi:hypothetical protein
LQKEGKHDVLVPMDLVRSVMGSLQGIELRVESALMEYLYGETAMGFSHTRIISGLINLYFLGASPMIFKPGALFEGHVCWVTSSGFLFSVLSKNQNPFFFFYKNASS